MMNKMRRLTKIENEESPSSRDPLFSHDPFLTRIPKIKERERERERERGRELVGERIRE